MGLTSGERYSTGRLTPQKRGILCVCQHFVSERVGVLAEYGGVVVRLPLGLRSLTLTPLSFPAQFACALFVLDIAGDGAKSVPDGQKQRQTRRSMDGASRSLAFGAGHLRKTRLCLIRSPLLTSKRSFFFVSGAFAGSSPSVTQ